MAFYAIEGINVLYVFHISCGFGNIMLILTWFKIRSCIEYQMNECKNLKNFKFSRKLPITLIPFIGLNKNQHAHGK